MKGYEALTAVQELDDRFLDEAVEWNEERSRRRLGIGKRIGLIAAAVVVVLALMGAGLRVFEPDLYARWVMNLTAGNVAATSELTEKMLAGPKEVIYEDETFQIESFGMVRSSQTFLFSFLITVKDEELIANQDYIYALSPVFYYTDFCLNGKPIENPDWGSPGAGYSHYSVPALADNEFLITKIVTVETEAVFDQFSLEFDHIKIMATDAQTLTAPENWCTEVPIGGVKWTCQLGGANEVPSLLLELDSNIMEKGKTYHLDKIRITPFNILFYTDTETEWVNNAPVQYYPSLDSLSIVKKDGAEATELLPGFSSSGSGNRENTTFIVIKTFSNLIQPEEIASISLDGQVIWERDQ